MKAVKEACLCQPGERDSVIVRTYSAGCVATLMASSILFKKLWLQVRRKYSVRDGTVSVGRTTRSSVAAVPQPVTSQVDAAGATCYHSVQELKIDEEEETVNVGGERKVFEALVRGFMASLTHTEDVIV